MRDTSFGISKTVAGSRKLRSRSLSNQITLSMNENDVENTRSALTVRKGRVVRSSGVVSASRVSANPDTYAGSWLNYAKASLVSFRNIKYVTV